MPETTAPKTYTFAKESEAFKRWFRKYYPGVDYDELYSEDKGLLRQAFKTGVEPVDGPATVTKEKRAAIRAKTIGFPDLAKKLNTNRELLSSTLHNNKERFLENLKKSGIKVTMIGDQYRFSNTSNTNIKKFANNIKTKFKYSEAVLNKAAQTLHSKNFREITKKQQKDIRAKLSAGLKIKKRTLFTALSDTAKAKVLKEFPDANFDLSKHGYDPQTIEGRNRNANVKDFIARGYKIRKFKPLPVAKQREVINTFTEIPANQWDFKNFQYGIPYKGQEALVQRIITRVNEPKPYRYGFQTLSPGGWMITQMDRAGDIHGDPNYKSILNKETNRVIGVKDRGTSYYANENVAPRGAKLITSHPKFKEVQKIVDIADIAKVPLISRTDAASKSLLTLLPEGFDNSRVTLSNLLQYIYQNKGLVAAQNAIEKHHLNPLKAGGDPINPKNLMLLRRDVNKLAETVDAQIRATGDFSRVPELEALKARISIGGQIEGAGSMDPRKYIISQTEEARDIIQQYKPKQIEDLRLFISKLRPGTKSFAKICGLTKASGGTVESCIERFDNDPIGNTQKIANMDAETPVLSKMKNTAVSFLQSPKLKAAGKFGALAAVGAAGAGAVKKFMNDDPETYLSNENQQKNMLIDMVTGQLDDTPVEEAPIGDAYLPAFGAATVAGTAAVAPSTIDAVRGGALGAKKSGITKTALKTLGRGLATTATPLGLLATEPLYLAEQIQEGDSLAEMATNPFNYLGPAFMGQASDFATKGLKSPGIASAMRLGISPSALKTVSRRFGLPGLALSLGISGYEMFDDYRNKRGMFSEE